MHGVRNRVEPQRFLSLTATDAGSPIVYYAKACLDTSLELQFRLSWDDFDEERYGKYVDLLAKVAQLPVFAASSGLFGPAGALGSGAAVLAVSGAVKVMLNAVDRWVDGDERSDFIANHTLHLETPGLARAKAGWLLLRDDDEGHEIMVSPSGDWRDPAEPVKGRDEALFYVSENGDLCYKESGKVVDDIEQPYVLMHISGTEVEQLDAFAPTAATAAVLDKFIDVDDGNLADLTALVTAYNDLTMARRAAKLEQRIKGATGAEKEKLVEQRKAVVKQIQDDDIRDIVHPV